MEDALDHPEMQRLLALVDNKHWVYHVADMLLKAEEHSIDKDYCFNWDEEYLDSMFRWRISPQGSEFWCQVSRIAEARPEKENMLPWFVNGNTEWRPK